MFGHSIYLNITLCHQCIYHIMIHGCPLKLLNLTTVSVAEERVILKNSFVIAVRTVGLCLNVLQNRNCCTQHLR